MLCERGAEVVRQLKMVQDTLGSGYLSAFPTSHFDRLEALQPVWAPYYVVRGNIRRRHPLAVSSIPAGLHVALPAHRCYASIARCALQLLTYSTPRGCRYTRSWRDFWISTC